MAAGRKKVMTLDRFLVRQQRAGTEGLSRVIAQVALAGKFVSSYIRRAALEGMLGLTGEENVQGEKVKQLDEIGNSVFIRSFEYVDIVGMLVSEEMEKPVSLSSGENPGDYIVLVDPIDGSSNLGVNGVVGSIFSVREHRGSFEDSVLRKGRDQSAAGYILYGPATYLVYTAGEGVHSFVLDERIGEFILVRKEIRMPDKGQTFSANMGNYSRWPDPAKDFADFLREGKYSLRYSGALAADLHRILHRGGIYCYPEDEKRPAGKLRLLYECAPVAMIAEQAGGAAMTGKTRVMDVLPEAVHQRIPFAAGSSYEVRKYGEIYRTANGQ